ncbi:plakophilin-4-like isoform X2 [Scleropages formosus]|nr:plakophilin-4-like isoform X2 [Scleropages formosus]
MFKYYETLVQGGMPGPEQTPEAEEGLLLPAPDGPPGHSIEPDGATTSLLESVKEQELQFERLTRELEAERQVVASQLERCRLGAESPSAASASSSEKSSPWRSTDASITGETKSRVTDSSQSPPFHLRSDQEQMSLYSPEQASLPERSAGNSRSSTQMNSYSDSGYQEAGSYYSCQNLGKSDLRPQLSYQGPSGVGAATLARNARAEGQASVQAPMTLPAAPGRAMRRVCSVPSRTQSPGYGSGFSPSRASLRGPMSLAEPKALSAIYSSSTLPAGPRTGSPYAAQTAESPGTSRRNTSPHQASRTGMAAVPQHYGPAPRFDTDLYSQPAYDIYDRMILPRPDSLADALIDEVQGLRSSYASQHSQHSRLGPDLHAAMSPERHIMPIYEDQTFQSPLYHSPSRATVDLNHSSQSAIYRTVSGMGNLQRGSSLRGSSRYQRGSYAMSSTSGYAEPYRTAQYRPAEASYATATRSPSIDSIQKDPREFGWRDPELPEVIHMLQHQFPSVQANAAAYLQHLCYGDNRVKAEVCRLGGIQHLVDLLDHKVLDVQKNTCGALRNLVYGKATDDNKVAVRNAGGIPALLRLLRRTVDAEVRELVTGVLWNLSSCDAVKMTIVRDALVPLTNTVVIPHSGWSSGSCFDDDHKLKFHSSLVLRNTSGCLRNLSSAGEEARKQMRCCEGLVDSLLYVIKACVSTSDFDSKIVENCICTLRNLSYRLELEMPQSGLLGTQELDGLLGRESPSKEVESSCWGRRRRKKKKTPPDEQWDGVGPIPGFSKSPRGVEMLWHPTVVKPYLTLLAESSNPATLEGAAGSLQNLSAGNWKFAAYIRAAVRKEKGLPILVELLRMDNDRVVCSVATALRNMALDVRNKELIGKYAMRDLVNRLPGSGTSLLSDETVAAVCCTLHEVTSKNMENAKALADTGGIEKLVNITKGRGGRYSMKVVKAAAQVLNTLWQYRDLRAIYKKDGWNQNHFLTPVSTLERDRYKSQPTLPSNSLQMSPINQSAGSATSSPAMLGIKEHRSNYQRAHSSMQFYNYQEDNHVHKSPFTGSGKPFLIDSYSSPSREETRRAQLYYADEPSRRNYDNYRLHLQSPMGYEDQYFEEAVPYAADYTSQPHGLKSNTNYVDFYSTTRRPSYRAEQYPGSPDSWV